MPVGDLFDVIIEGDEPFTQALRLAFDNARKLYRQKLLPLLEQEHGVRRQTSKTAGVEALRAQRFCTDDRLMKTLLLSALAPEVEVLRALTPSRLAALNHGTVRSPIPGQESQIVLQKCRNWAAQVGEIKIADDGRKPGYFPADDRSGHRRDSGQRPELSTAMATGCTKLAVPALRATRPGRGERTDTATVRDSLARHQAHLRTPVSQCTRTAARQSSRAEDPWRMVIDYPFDQEGYTPADDHARLQKFRDTGAASNCLVWLPAFFTPRTMEDLGRLVLLDHVLAGNNLQQYGSHLSQVDREQARILLHNQRDQMRQRLRNAMLAAYGISTLYADAIDTAHDLEQHFVSLNPTLTLQPPVGASFTMPWTHLFLRRWRTSSRHIPSLRRR